MHFLNLGVKGLKDKSTLRQGKALVYVVKVKRRPNFDLLVIVPGHTEAFHVTVYARGVVFTAQRNESVG